MKESFITLRYSIMLWGLTNNRSKGWPFSVLFPHALPGAWSCLEPLCSSPLPHPSYIKKPERFGTTWATSSVLDRPRHWSREFWVANLVLGCCSTGLKRNRHKGSCTWEECLERLSHRWQPKQCRATTRLQSTLKSPWFMKQVSGPPPGT